MKLMIAIAALCLGLTAQAEEHKLTTITGSHDIQLKEYDHSIAGSVKDFVIFGNVSETSNSAELTMKKDGQMIRTVFQKEGNELGGTIHHEVEGRAIDTRIVFKGLDKDNNKINFEVNGKPAVVTVLADAMENNHYINPQYVVTYEGQLIMYKLNNGQACYRYSTFMAFLMLGAVLH